MTIVTRDTGGKRRLAIGAAVAAVAGVAALSLLLIGGDSPSAGTVPGADAGAETASERASAEPIKARITFAVRPEGAEILIDDEPIEAVAARLDPGSYRVEIRKSGYESWVETIEIGAGEAHVIHKELAPGGNDQAVLKVRSTPSRLRVRIDGEMQPERTPLRVEVDPGTRRVEVIGPSSSWREEFDAAADTVYSFHPVLGEVEESRGRTTATRSRAPHQEASPAPDPQPDAQPAEPAQAPASRPELEVDSPVSRLAPLPFEVNAPPERDTGPRAPKTVSGAAVERLAGETPVLPNRARGASGSHVSVAICIDDRGTVTDVDVVTGVGVDIERALRRGIRRWTFRPYLEGGERIPVCFRQTFRLP